MCSIKSYREQECVQKKLKKYFNKIFKKHLWSNTLLAKLQTLAYNSTKEWIYPFFKGFLTIFIAQFFLASENFVTKHVMKYIKTACYGPIVFRSTFLIRRTNLSFNLSYSGESLWFCRKFEEHFKEHFHDNICRSTRNISRNIHF